MLMFVLPLYTRQEMSPRTSRGCPPTVTFASPPLVNGPKVAGADVGLPEAAGGVADVVGVAGWVVDGAALLGVVDVLVAAADGSAVSDLLAPVR
jgi:hypothetical protein